MILIPAAGQYDNCCLEGQKRPCALHAKNIFWGPLQAHQQRFRNPACLAFCNALKPPRLPGETLSQPPKIFRRPNGVAQKYARPSGEAMLQVDTGRLFSCFYGLQPDSQIAR